MRKKLVQALALLVVIVQFSLSTYFYLSCRTHSTTVSPPKKPKLLPILLPPDSPTLPFDLPSLPFPKPISQKHDFLSVQTCHCFIPLGLMEELNIAFLILVHKEWFLIKRFLKAIWHPDNFYLIHVPLDKEELYVTVKGSSFLQDHPNVQLMKNRFQVSYGYSDLMFLEYAGMIELLNSPALWDYMAVVTGGDYPLVSPSLFRRYLRYTWPMNLVPSSGRLSELTWNFRGKYYGVKLKEGNETKIGGVPVLRPKVYQPHLVELFSGLPWVTITRDFASFLSRSINASQLLIHLSTVLVAEEMFWSTSIYHSPFRHLHRPDGIHYQNFEFIPDGRSSKIDYITQASAATFEVIHNAFEQNCLFVRKIHPQYEDLDLFLNYLDDVAKERDRIYGLSEPKNPKP